MQRHPLAFYKVAKYRDNAPLNCFKRPDHNHKSMKALTPGRGGSHIKKTGVFVVLFRG